MNPLHEKMSHSHAHVVLHQTGLLNQSAVSVPTKPAQSKHEKLKDCFSLDSDTGLKARHELIRTELDFTQNLADKISIHDKCGYFYVRKLKPHESDDKRKSLAICPRCNYDAQGVYKGTWTRRPCAALCRIIYQDTPILWLVKGYNSLISFAPMFMLIVASSITSTSMQISDKKPEIFTLPFWDRLWMWLQSAPFYIYLAAVMLQLLYTFRWITYQFRSDSRRRRRARFDHLDKEATLLDEYRASFANHYWSEEEERDDADPASSDADIRFHNLSKLKRFSCCQKWCFQDDGHPPDDDNYTQSTSNYAFFEGSQGYSRGMSSDTTMC